MLVLVVKVVPHQRHKAATILTWKEKEATSRQEACSYVTSPWMSRPLLYECPAKYPSAATFSSFCGIPEGISGTFAGWW